MESLSIDIPLDGMGVVGFPAEEAISPVFTLWITLVLMYLSKSLPTCPSLRLSGTPSLHIGVLSARQG